MTIHTHSIDSAGRVPAQLEAQSLAAQPLGAQHLGTQLEAEPAQVAGVQAARQAPGRAAQAWRLLRHLIEMQLAMQPGMILFGLLAASLRASPDYAPALRPGADLYILGDGLFMTIPMVAWMLFRGHGPRLSLEMAAFMLAPGLALVGLGWLGLWGVSAVPAGGAPGRLRADVPGHAAPPARAPRGVHGPRRACRLTPPAIA